MCVCVPQFAQCQCAPSGLNNFFKDVQQTTSLGVTNNGKNGNVSAHVSTSTKHTVAMASDGKHSNGQATVLWFQFVIPFYLHEDNNSYRCMHTVPTFRYTAIIISLSTFLLSNRIDEHLTRTGNVCTSYGIVLNSVESNCFAYDEAIY